LIIDLLGLSSNSNSAFAKAFYMEPMKGRGPRWRFDGYPDLLENLRESIFQIDLADEEAACVPW
jgi:hypothetical protein